MVARAPPKRRAIGPGGEGTEHAADATHGEEQADHPGRGVDLSHQEDDLDRGGDAAEQVGGRRRCRDGPQEGVAEDEAQTFGDAAHESRVPALGPDGLRLGRADGAHRDGRDDEAHRVDGDCRGTADGLDEAAGHTRARHRRDLRAAGELGIALHQVVPADQGGQVGLVRHIEEDGQDAGGQSDDEELGKGETAERIGDRHGAQREHPADVGGDHDPPAAHPVHPDAGRQPDDEEGRRGCRGQQAHFEGRGMQRPARPGAEWPAG